MNINKGKKLLSDLKLYSDYLKWDKSKNRFETWNEACVDVLDTHFQKYGQKVKHLIDEVLPSYQQNEFLTSQRNLQYRWESIKKNNARLYNCSVMYAYSPDCFNKGFFLLLSGCGLGVNLKKKYVSMMPDINKRGTETVTFTIPDTIEGWAESSKVLISSYCLHPSLYPEYYGKKIRFDYSEIREEGSYISGGFSAPGSDGLKKNLELVESFIEKQLDNNQNITFRSYIIYNIFMYLSNAVLSGGIRRAAMNVLIEEDDLEMVYAKTGDWRAINPHFARSNNSIGLMKNSFSKERFQELINLNTGDNDIGFVLLEAEDQMLNPCFEISFSFFNEIKDKNFTVIQLCNLTEGNAMACYNSKGKFDENNFYRICRNLAIVGTLQAGYTSFPYLGKETETIVAGESLLGCSITGWMNVPELFNPIILEKGVEVIRQANKEVAEIIGINIAARLTCTKPSGNASVILQTPSGIHPEHSQRYFRIMQMNKNLEVSKYLAKNNSFMLENSVWSPTNTDYVVYVPIENPKGAYFKENLKDIKHLKLINMVQEHWVFKGNNVEIAYNPNIHHNVSNTVLIDNKEEIIDYIYNNQKYFVAVSFLDRFGDKDFNQAPFTSVLTASEILETYGEGCLLISGLIVDGLDVFDNNLWEACDFILNRDKKLEGSRKEKFLKKDWLDRSRKFAKNYFKGDIKKLVYCLKDIHLYHKWCTINRELKYIDFSEILSEPQFKKIDEMGALACAGGQCEI
jgi:ribonucleoside-diphosphate reductase alpha chain